MNKNLKTISFAFAMFAVVGMISSTSAVFADDDGIELEAKIVESGIEILEASFEIEDGLNKLEIEVEGRTGDTCDVSINTDPVYTGTIDLDANGNGELEVDTITVEEGDTITVENCGDLLSEVFVLDVEDEDGDDEGEDHDDDEETEIQSSKSSKSNHGRGR